MGLVSRAKLLTALASIRGQDLDDVFAPILAALAGGLDQHNLSPHAKITNALRQAPFGLVAVPVVGAPGAGVEVNAGGDHLAYHGYPQLLDSAELVAVTLFANAGLTATWSVIVNGVVTPTSLGAGPYNIAAVTPAIALVQPGVPIPLTSSFGVRIAVTAGAAKVWAAAWLRSKHVR